MSALFVTIEQSPRCGVADYTARLYQSATVEGDERWHLTAERQSWRGLFARCKDFDALVFQYPARLYARSLMPIILFVYCKLRGVKVNLNLHENAEVKLGRKLINLVLTSLADKIIMTSEYEVAQLPGLCRGKAAVNRIGPNIAVDVTQIYAQRKIQSPRKQIVFFGLIKRDNGIDKFMHLAECLKPEDPELEFVLVGAVVDRAYCHQLEQSCPKLGVMLRKNLSEEEVSRELLSSSYAYLWYPDGVSDRRGAFLACLNHGLVVFANRGHQTPEYLLDAFIHNDNDRVKQTIHQFEANHAAYQVRIDRMLDTAKLYDWRTIGTKFRQLVVE